MCDMVQQLVDAIILRDLDYPTPHGMSVVIPADEFQLWLDAAEQIEMQRRADRGEAGNIA